MCGNVELRVSVPALTLNVYNTHIGWQDFFPRVLIIWVWSCNSNLLLKDYVLKTIKDSLMADNFV